MLIFKFHDMDIGKIKQVPLREIWKREDSDFTVWLENNIAAARIQLTDLGPVNCGVLFGSLPGGLSCCHPSRVPGL